MSCNDTGIEEILNLIRLFFLFCYLLYVSRLFTISRFDLSRFCFISLLLFINITPFGIVKSNIYFTCIFTSFLNIPLFNFSIFYLMFQLLFPNISLFDIVNFDFRFDLNVKHKFLVLHEMK